MENHSCLSVTDYLRRRDKTRSGRRTAIEFDGNLITQDEYWNRVEHYKRWFLSLGFFYGCGKPVAICNLNAPEYEFIYIALLELGAVVSTVSLSFFQSDVYRHSVDKGADTIILSAEYISPVLKNAFSQLGDNNGEKRIRRVIFTSAGDYRPEDKAAEYNSKFNYKEMVASLELPNNIEVIYPGEIKRLGDRNSLSLNPDDLIDLLGKDATYSNTGGTTTGIPKCAVHTHKAIVSLLRAHESDVYPEFPLKEGDRALLLIPISHITSQFYALLLRRSAGANIVYNTEAFEPHSITKTLVESEINDVIAPFGLYSVIAHSTLAQNDLRHLKIPTCGGEPTPESPTKFVNERLLWSGSTPIFIGGGSTEFGSATMVAYGLEDRCNETGMSLPGAESVIINPLTGKKAIDGEDGILYTNCPWQMRGYLNDEKATAEFFNYTDDNGKVFGTNNDIGKVTREYKSKPVYAMQGRVFDFILPTSDANSYTMGVNLKAGKVDPVDFNRGEMLFRVRDKILNIPGVLEVEAILLPKNDGDTTGTPVVNVVIAQQQDPVAVLHAIYSSNKTGETNDKINDEFLPFGVLFRSGFARSLATDKRDIAALVRDRGVYYSVDSDGTIFGAELPKGEEPIITIITDTSVIQSIAPPTPRAIRVEE